ncbi:obscurin-like [Pygocentrus nattereri]|uniref:Ig-like domain-containing protein n=1 Tax=Pygocentrus nattereri TaxID=42514 RepID=A0AAR2M093_PYGNA|nr:obscurin-like [Pygocentrus nattereri]
MECLYLLLVVFHFTAGCSLSGEIVVRGHTGGSVVLPCSCTDLQTKPQRVTWQVYRGKEWTEVFSADQYRDRLQQFNDDSPANLSLLISDLREEDDGDYRCQTEKESRFFRLFIKGCDLMKSGETEEVTRFSGESVVLLCSCTDLQTKPHTVKWKFRSAKSGIYNIEEIYSTQTGQHRDKVRLTNKYSGNLSLLISDLTEEDQGDYSCSVQGDHKDVRLHVKVRETPTRLWTTDPTTPSEDHPSTAVTESERIMMCVAH